MMTRWADLTAVILFLLMGIVGSVFLFAVVGLATAMLAGGKVTFFILLFGSILYLLRVNSRLTWGKSGS